MSETDTQTCDEELLDFAAKAMQGIYACPVQLYRADGTPMPDPLTSADIAKMAYEEADAMIAERDKDE